MSGPSPGHIPSSHERLGFLFRTDALLYLQTAASILSTTLADAAPPTAILPPKTVKVAFLSRDAMALRRALLPEELA